VTRIVLSIAVIFNFFFAQRSVRVCRMITCNLTKVNLAKVKKIKCRLFVSRAFQIRHPFKIISLIFNQAAYNERAQS